MAILHDAEDIRRSAAVLRFEGEQHGDGMAVSFFAVTPPPGRGATPHAHPYAEVFLIEEGEARFTVGGEEIEVRGGQVLVVPPETVHSFVNTGEALRIVSMHPSPRVVQRDAEPGET